MQVNPQRVKEARLAAGLTMAQLGGDRVSRAFIHYLETGAARPSAEVLTMIARKTRKPMRFFMSPGADRALSGKMVAADLVKLAARVRQLAEVGSIDITQRQALRLLESSLRQGAVLARNLDSRKPGD